VPGAWIQQFATVQDVLTAYTKEGWLFDGLGDVLLTVAISSWLDLLKPEHDLSLLDLVNERGRPPMERSADALEARIAAFVTAIPKILTRVKDLQQQVKHLEAENADELESLHRHSLGQHSSAQTEFDHQLREKKVEIQKMKREHEESIWKCQRRMNDLEAENASVKANLHRQLQERNEDVWRMKREHDEDVRKLQEQLSDLQHVLASNQAELQHLRQELSNERSFQAHHSSAQAESNHQLREKNKEIQKILMEHENQCGHVNDE
jgi:chromosome segregation ATPase